jgi:class 3 adenylate cyclase
LKRPLSINSGAAGLYNPAGFGMPIFMDRHNIRGQTAAGLAEAHRKDVEIQDRYGVKFLTYWFDQERGTTFCLIDAPDAESARQVHEAAHGEIAEDIIPVDLSAVEAFLGRIGDPPADTKTGSILDRGLRAIMFTDIVGSTALTARLGDVRGLEMIRAHDALTRRALEDHSGREVKRTGDGIMASFQCIANAVACGCSIQRAFERFNIESEEKLRVRVGIHAGEPVEDDNDLFGVTVHVAARICKQAAPDSVAVSTIVRDLTGGRFSFAELGHFHLKGISGPIHLHEVKWRLNAFA